MRVLGRLDAGQPQVGEGDQPGDLAFAWLKVGLYEIPKRVGRMNKAVSARDQVAPTNKGTPDRSLTAASTRPDRERPPRTAHATSQMPTVGRLWALRQQAPPGGGRLFDSRNGPGTIRYRPLKGPVAAGGAFYCLGHRLLLLCALGSRPRALLDCGPVRAYLAEGDPRSRIRPGMRVTGTWTARARHGRHQQKFR